MRTYILDDAGKPVACPDEREWRHWMNQQRDLIVAQTVVGNTLVSTRFTGTAAPCVCGQLTCVKVWETAWLPCAGDKSPRGKPTRAVTYGGARAEAYAAHYLEAALASHTRAHRGIDALIAQIPESYP